MCAPEVGVGVPQPALRPLAVLEPHNQLPLTEGCPAHLPQHHRQVDWASLIGAIDHGAL